MSENERKPSIRFAGFDDAWEQRKLEEIAKIINRTDDKSDAPVMMITAQNGFIEQSERYAFDNAGESLKKYTLLYKGELAYNHGASKIRPYGSCFSLKNVAEARIPFVYHCFSVGDNDSNFMSIELNGHDVENQLRRIVSSGARMDGLLNISFEDYSSVKILIPEKEEQERISGFFEQLDTLITLHQRKYDKLVSVKKSMLEKMFPKNGSNKPELRFSGFTDPWEQRKFEDFAVRTSEISSDLKYPRVEYEDIVSGTGTLNKDLSSKQSCKTGIKFKSGDVLFGKLRPYLQNWLFPSFEGLAVGDFWVLHPENIDGSFLYRLIQSHQFNEIANQSTGTKMPRADWKLVSKTEFEIPKAVDEQKLIGQYFIQLDTLITLHQRKLEKLKNIKKSMLEKMFV